ncbi:MAG: SH3 domain-containing protein [Proteobacteria bacterium]|nr:SH3 domain-containing protein [Pseudomonadota bacterium]
MTLVALPAAALDFLSLAEAGVMYDAPSLKATPLFVIARSTPVEVVVVLEGWYKVRDAGGSLAWIEKRQLSEKHTLLVTAARAQVRAQAEPNATPVFEAEKDVILELVEPVSTAGWAKVRHRDGQSGFVRTNQVWGM